MTHRAEDMTPCRQRHAKEAGLGRNKEACRSEARTEPVIEILGKGGQSSLNGPLWGCVES